MGVGPKFTGLRLDEERCMLCMVELLVNGWQGW